MGHFPLRHSVLKIKFLFGVGEGKHTDCSIVTVKFLFSPVGVGREFFVCLFFPVVNSL